MVDDASTDGSQELIRSFGGRVIPVLQAKNGGQAAAMNAGFLACKGDVVIFLDADDYLYPSAAETVAGLYKPDVGSSSTVSTSWMRVAGSLTCTPR